MKTKEKKNKIKYAFKSLSLLIKNHPIYLIFQIIDTICSIARTLIPIDLINQIIQIYMDNGLLLDDKITKITSITIIYVAILIIVSSITSIVELITFYVKNHFTLFFSTYLFRKLDTIDYAFHEQENFLDNYTRALDNGPENVYSLAVNQIDLVKNIVMSFSVFAYIVSTSLFGIVYAIVIACIFYILRRYTSKSYFKEGTEARPYFRERMYLRRVYFVKDSIPDIKTTGIHNVLIENHERLTDNLLRIYKKHGKRRAVAEGLAAFLMSTIYPVILLISIYGMLKSGNAAAFAALTLAAGKISTLVTSTADIVGSIQTHSLEAKVPFEVLDMNCEIEKAGAITTLDEFKELRVENLDFAYTDRLILKNINLHVKKGEKIAIVGHNGAGKTTLVKLLLRLYDGLNGDIYYNDINYKQINTDPLRRSVGAVFQNSEVYSVTIGENVLLRKLNSEQDYELVRKALKFAGLYDIVSELEDGIDTVVTREFNRKGMIFSGGNQQKLAVARGYAQNYNLFILDEPSSALDPIAETQMYKNMLELGKDKTIIFISHRLSATANVDRIYLFETGEILEWGSHEELMRNTKGRYYEMFSSQAEKYLRGDNND